MLSENEITELSWEVLITIVSATLVAVTTNSTDTLSALSRDQDICRDPSPLAVAVRFSGAKGGPYYNYQEGIKTIHATWHKKCPLPKKVTKKFLPRHLLERSMRLMAMHCTVVPLFPMVPMILSGGSLFSAEEPFVTIPRFVAKKLMFDGLSVAKPVSLPGKSMFQVVLNVEFTAQLTSTCVPRGSTTGSGCSRNTCSH